MEDVLCAEGMIEVAVWQSYTASFFL